MRGCVHWVMVEGEAAGPRPFYINLSIRVTAAALPQAAIGLRALFSCLSKVFFLSFPHFSSVVHWLLGLLFNFYAFVNHSNSLL